MQKHESKASPMSTVFSIIYRAALPIKLRLFENKGFRAMQY